MKAFNMSPIEALERIRESRPIVEPNDGFMQQLGMYHRMQMPDDVEKSPIYQRWMYYREVQISSECGQAPDTDNIRFEDEQVDEQSDDVDAEYKCRKCRCVLSWLPYYS